MLYDLKWLDIGQKFPPSEEINRLEKYRINEKLFANDDLELSKSYDKFSDRILRVIGNFRDMIDFPVIFNYQRMVSLKTADLVAGEYPTILATSKVDLAELREETDFDSQLYTTVIDLSRYGDAVWRIYTDEATGKGKFTVWNPSYWYPVVNPDGTNRIDQQVLCWRFNTGTADIPKWRLYVQIHEVGSYEYREYELDYTGAEIRSLLSSEIIATGLGVNAVMNLRNIRTSDTVYGYDDYTVINTLVSELMSRIGQISSILDKHANPAMTGPASMLTIDPETGRVYLETGSFYAVSPGEEQPKYLTWDGQLSAAFEEVKIILDQLYILSELGSALLGGAEKTGQAISGTAMRFKMVNPLAKARRIANAITKPSKILLSALSTIGYNPVSTTELSIKWKDGIPSDPREDVEIARLAAGANQILPLIDTLETFMGLSSEEAKKAAEEVYKEKEANLKMQAENSAGGFGNPLAKGSTTSMSNFKGTKNSNNTKK